MCSTHNIGKSVITEKFIRALKNKIYKYMTSVSKNLYIEKLDDIVNKYNNTYNTIKMKPADVKSNTYTDSSKEINNKDPKCKICDTVRISKYKNIFAKGYTPNWSEEVFVIKKIKINVDVLLVILKVLMCLRALHAYMLTCLRALHAYMLMCLRVLHAYVLTCLVCLLVYIPCLFTCSRANVLCMLMCSRKNLLSSVTLIHINLYSN